MKIPVYFRYYNKEKQNPFNPETEQEQRLVWNVERRFFEETKNGSKMKPDLSSMIQYYFDNGFTDCDDPATEYLAMLLDWYKQYDSANTIWGFIDLCARRYDLESIIINRRDRRTIVFRSVKHYHDEDASKNPISQAADKFFTDRVLEQTSREANLKDQEMLFEWTARLVEDRALRRCSRMRKYFDLSEAGKNTKNYLQESVETDPEFKQIFEAIFEATSKASQDPDGEPEADPDE